MFSLRVAILIALSTQLILKNEVCGYVVVPVSSNDDDPSPSGDEESSCSQDAAAAEETTTAPFQTQSSQAYAASYGVLQQNVYPRNQTSNKGFPCGSENGCYIRHFRQYNYYYPNGQRVTLPIQNQRPLQPQNLFSGNGASSSIQMTNNNGRVTVQTSNSKPTVSYNLPGVTSFVPNNGFNYVYSQFDSGLRQGTQAQTNVQSQAQAQAQAQSYAGNYDQRLVNEEEQVVSEELSEEQATTTPNSQNDGSSSTIPSDDENVNQDTTTYITGPNMYGQSRVRVVKNGNNGNFRSQYVSLSSNIQSRPPPPTPIIAEEEQQEEVQKTEQPLTTPSFSYGNYGNSKNFQSQQILISTGLPSKPLPIISPKEEVISTTTSNTATPSSSSSTILPAVGPSITWPNYVNRNRLTYGYNPYFQLHQFGVATLPPAPVPAPLTAPIPPQLPVPVPVPGLPVRNAIYGPNNFQFLNPVNAWTNYALQSPFYDITDVSPSYSVVL